MRFVNMHPDLLVAQQVLYKPAGLQVHAFKQEAESKDYGACTFSLNNQCIVFRVAKITPTKIGQFVTLWKRVENGPILPYDMADSIDIVIISVRKEDKLGQFIFPKDVLLQKGFIAKSGIGGKRAMRVYPSWDIPDNKQAKKTEDWQLLYFIKIEPLIDFEKSQRLFFSLLVT